MKKKWLALLGMAGCMAMAVSTQAQVGIYMGPRFGWGYGVRYGRMHPGYRRPQQRKSDDSRYHFQPSFSINLGYGFPNLDKNEFSDSYQYYSSTGTQTGNWMGSVDYRFSRNSSLGLLIIHGSATAPYYDYSASPFAPPAFTGTLNNWAVMLNYKQYFPVNNAKIAPYLRTALGINIWDEHYTDTNGNTVPYSGNPSDLAYQFSLGSTFYFSENTGMFIEASYGKYILGAGLTFTFK